MNLNEIFDKYILLEDKLVSFGFTKDSETYKIRKVLSNKEMYVDIMINKKTFSIEVFERDDKEKFLPFYIKESTGSYVNKIKEEVNEIVLDILHKCFVMNDIKEELLSYIKDKYGTIIESPWQDMPKHNTMKTNDTKKWYGLFMDIPYKSLHIEKEGTITVLNLRNYEDKVKELIDYKTFFPAYHMNKKYWFTAVINNNVNIEIIKSLIDESYNIMNKK